VRLEADLAFSRRGQ